MGLLACWAREWHLHTYLTTSESERTYEHLKKVLLRQYRNKQSSAELQVQLYSRRKSQTKPTSIKRLLSDRLALDQSWTRVCTWLPFPMALMLMSARYCAFFSHRH